MKYKIDMEEFLSKNGMKQKTLADILDVPPSYISDACKGKTFSQKQIQKILEHKEWDLSMITEVKRGNDVVMSREVFELIKQQTDTILSQQRTIETLSTKGGGARLEDSVDYADASGSDLER